MSFVNDMLNDLQSRPGHSAVYVDYFQHNENLDKPAKRILSAVVLVAIVTVSLFYYVSQVSFTSVLKETTSPITAKKFSKVDTLPDSTPTKVTYSKQSVGNLKLEKIRDLENPKNTSNKVASSENKKGRDKLTKKISKVGVNKRVTDTVKKKENLSDNASLVIAVNTDHKQAFQSAKTNYQNREYQKAIASLLSIKNLSEQGKKLLLASYQNENQHQLAISLANSLLRAHPKDAEILLAKAVSLEALQQIKASVIAYRQAYETGLLSDIQQAFTLQQLSLLEKFGGPNAN